MIQCTLINGVNVGMGFAELLKSRVSFSNYNNPVNPEMLQGSADACSCTGATNERAIEQASECATVEASESSVRTTESNGD